MTLSRQPPPPWCESEVLAGDASTRSYARLRDRAGRSAVLVAYPGTVRRQLARDLAVRAWCHGLGLVVPRMMGCDPVAGWAILEDFGATDAAGRLAREQVQARRALSLEALGPLQLLARLPCDELPPWNPPLDAWRLRWELAGFELWYLRHRRQRRPSPSVAAWLDGLARSVAAHPRRICHRDYHFNNLFFLDDGRVGVIDYQDILIGPEAYDLVSLTGERAALAVLDPGLREELAAAWAIASGAAPGWRDRVVEVHLQRALKVLGTFARLVAAGGSRYRDFLADLERAAAADLARVSAPPELVDILLDL